MQTEIAARLVALNEQFYQTFGREFSATRQRLQPGVWRILEGLQGGENILDLGCGNGELARELLRRGHRGRYTGLDFSLPLLETARKGPDREGFVFLEVNFGAPEWESALRSIPHASLDIVTAFAFLHHIPGEALRLELLRKMHALLCPAGKFIHSEWQFHNSEKLRRRIQPWSEAGLEERQVEAGDCLLDWRGGGRGLRYVHLFTETELASLAASAGFRVCETFLSDGQNGRLGLYQAWQPTSNSLPPAALPLSDDNQYE